MNITIEDISPVEKRVEFELPWTDVAPKLDKAYDSLRKGVRLPGFRPGKVPMALVAKHWRQHVTGEELQSTIGDSSAQIVSERGLRPAGQPKIEITSLSDGSDLEYRMALELLPEIEPMDLAQLELTRTVVDIPEAEIEQALQRIATDQAKSEPVTEPRPAAQGDVVVADFVGRIDGNEFEGGKAEGHYIRIGANMLIPGFEEQLIGAMPGEKREVKVTFPADYPRKELADKAAVFDVEVKELRQLLPAAIDNELAKSLGLDSVEALRQRVREQLEGEYAAASRTRLKRQLLDRLAENHSYEMPPGMVESEFEQIWTQVEADRKAGRIDPEDQDKSEEALKAEYRGIAERRVKLGLLLSEIGRRGQVEVKQDELARAAMTEARRYPGQERKVIDFFQNNPDALARLRAPLYEDKVVDYIFDTAKVAERKVSPEQFAEELKQDDA